MKPELILEGNNRILRRLFSRFTTQTLRLRAQTIQPHVDSWGLRCEIESDKGYWLEIDHCRNDEFNVFIRSQRGTIQARHSTFIELDRVVRKAIEGALEEPLFKTDKT